MKVGLFIDSGNLYHGVKDTYKSKVDYKAILSYVADIGSVETANVYGVEMGKVSDTFKTRLQELGYCTKFRHRTGNSNVAMTVDILAQADQLDCIILCSSDGNLAPVVRSLISVKEKTVMILGCDIAVELSTITGVMCLGIPPSFLMGATNGIKK